MKLSGTRVGVISFVWGLAEGTFFFIVPDIFVMMVTLFSYKNGLKAWGWSILGSLVAVVVLMLLVALFGAHALLQATTILPGIDEVMNNDVSETVQTHLPLSLTMIFDGIALKTYALTAFEHGYPLWIILFWTVFARILRMGPGMVIAFGARFVAGTLIARRPRLVLAIYAGCWVIVYTAYWLKLGPFSS